METDLMFSKDAFYEYCRIFEYHYFINRPKWADNCEKQPITLEKNRIVCLGTDGVIYDMDKRWLVNKCV